MTEFTFTDRLSWISWRADWRASYAEASEAIRGMKRRMAGLHAQLRACTADAAPADAGVPRKRSRIDFDVSSLQEDLVHARRHAHALMVLRTEATEHKKEQMADRKRIAA